VKLLWYDGQGLCLFSKQIDRGLFVWPVTQSGKVSLSSAQLSMLLEGIDWRRPERTVLPLLDGYNRLIKQAFRGILLDRVARFC